MPVDTLRIGNGYDVHPWSDDPGRPLILGGVRFEEHPGLAGHSDADVIAHACTDALLGAVGAGDIGAAFPDNDESLAGADSIEMLRWAAGRIAEDGWRVVNLDCTVVLDSPKLAPKREQIEARLSSAAGGPVSVKGKRTEGMAGLAGGVHCYAVALVAQR